MRMQDLAHGFIQVDRAEFGLRSRQLTVVENVDDELVHARGGALDAREVTLTVVVELLCVIFGEQWTDRVLGPRYAAQVQLDEAMVEGHCAGLAGAPMMRRKDPRGALLAMGLAGDAEAASAFYRIDNLLSSLDEVLADSALKTRLDTFLNDVEAGPAGPGPLPRAEFEALLRY